ncbi:hypothetical protein EV182_000874 [Spiromyces aspiralis]|uniref:Uncharacterized protein n=1 Tax=Spiromyces aspiralis TaxID=68401 RepID=A0ACC1HJT3_9FUNG|nr:hypothetical protein EV182_000874 [Spiromyces aspiralis]
MVKEISLIDNGKSGKLSSRGRILHLIDPRGYKDDMVLEFTKSTLLGTQKRIRVRAGDLVQPTRRQWRATWIATTMASLGSSRVTKHKLYLPDVFLKQDPILKALHRKVQINSTKPSE